MRKLLLSILLVLTLVLMTLFMKNGLSIGQSFRIYGFQGISDESQQLTQAISDANNQNNQYTNALTSMQTDVEGLMNAKKEYLDAIARSSDSEIKHATQTKSYTIEYLWSRVGNLATSQGVKIKMEIVNSTLPDQEYRNLNFTVNGRYLAVAQFISSLENDSNLDFTIDNFHMSPGTGTIIEATFVVKDVKIKKEDVSNSNPSYVESPTQENSSNTQDTVDTSTSTSNSDTENTTNNETANDNTTSDDTENTTKKITNEQAQTNAGIDAIDEVSQ